jgi:diguanylate cyclase (GGDEF)-like protein/PAS domain S-box-containing protein
MTMRSEEELYQDLIDNYNYINKKLSLIQEQELYLRTVLNTTRDAFMVLSANGTIKDVNDAFYQMTGYTKEDLSSINVYDITEYEDPSITVERLRQIGERGSLIFETKHKRKDGSFFEVEISAACLKKEPIETVCFIRDITDRKNAEASLKHSHDLMRYIIEHNGMAVSIQDKNMNFMYVSRPYLELYRVENTDIIGKYIYDVYPNLPQWLRDVHQRVLKGEIVRMEEDPYFYEDGTSNWIRWECRPWYENDGSIGGIVFYAEDITEQKRIEQLLYNEKEFFKTTILSVGDGVITTDNSGLVTMMNPVAEKFTGWANKEACGRKLETVFSIINEYSGMPYRDHVEKVLESGSVVEYTYNTMLVSKSGTEIPVEIRASPIKDSGGRIAGVVFILRDYSERKSRLKEIEYLSYNDYLTGLYNRRFMEDSLKGLDTAESLPLSIMFIDVNGLKLTNDAFGHETGDRLLKVVSGILKKACKPNHIVGRMGGDEFCIILPQTDKERTEAVKQSILSETLKLNPEPMIVSLAVGYAVKNTMEQDIKAIMTSADNNMYKEKLKNGRLMRSQTVEMVLSNINENYNQERIHTERVSHYCELIAKAMGFSEKEVRDIKMAGDLHDIGKIMVPPQLLNKSEKLTKEEFEIIKRHPEIGYQIIKSVDEYVHLSDYVLHHHERWDGTGYPEGISGTSIPLYSRIIAVADAFEAMTAIRPYQKTKTKEEAVEELKRCSGSQFDSEIVSVFVEKVLQGG